MEKAPHRITVTIFPQWKGQGLRFFLSFVTCLKITSFQLLSEYTHLTPLLSSFHLFPQFQTHISTEESTPHRLCLLVPNLESCCAGAAQASPSLSKSLWLSQQVSFHTWNKVHAPAVSDCSNNIPQASQWGCFQWDTIKSLGLSLYSVCLEYHKQPTTNYFKCWCTLLLLIW